MKFVKEKRKQVKLTLPELAAKAGVGLRLVREFEQGKDRFPASALTPLILPGEKNTKLSDLDTERIAKGH